MKSDSVDYMLESHEQLVANMTHMKDQMKVARETLHAAHYQTLEAIDILTDAEHHAPVVEEAAPAPVHHYSAGVLAGAFVVALL